MTEFNEADLAKASLVFIRVGLRALAHRAMEFVGLFACIAMFGIALAQQSMVSLAVASTFTVLVFLPVLLKGRKEKSE